MTFKKNVCPFILGAIFVISNRIQWFCEKVLTHFTQISTDFRTFTKSNLLGVCLNFPPPTPVSLGCGLSCSFFYLWTNRFLLPAWSIGRAARGRPATSPHSLINKGVAGARTCGKRKKNRKQSVATTSTRQGRTQFCQSSPNAWTPKHQHSKRTACWSVTCLISAKLQILFRRRII